MATKLYLRTGLSEWSSGNNDARLDTVAAAWINQPLSLTAGSSPISSTIPTVTGPTNGLENPSGSLGRAFISQPLDADVTISGSVTWNIWASESNMSANVAINGRLEVIDGATGTITLIDQTARTAELAVTTNALNNFSETPGAGVACKRGDRLRVRIYGDDSVSATMATGYTFTYTYDGSTAAADGDTWLQLTENLTFVSEPAGTTIYPTDTASAVSTASVDREAWTSRGAGVQTDVRNTAAGYTAPLQITDTAGGTVVDWFTRQLTAFTLGGAVRVNARALESATAANASIRCEIARVASDGTSPTVWGAMTFGTELTASEAAQSFLVSGDDLAITDGQRLRIRFYIDDAGIGTGGAMAASQTVTLYYAGTSGGASGDTYLTFTQTLTEFSAGTTVTPTTLALVVASAGVPTVTASNHQLVTPPTATLASTAYAPTIALAVIPSTATLATAAFAPRLSNSAYAAAVQALAPLGYWRLGEPSGTVAYSLWGPNLGYFNTPTLGASSLLTTDNDTAVTFARASSEAVGATFAAGAGTAGVTVAAWVKFGSLGAGELHTIFNWGDQDGAAGFHWMYYTVDTALLQWQWGDGSVQVAGNAWSPGTTTHFVVITHDYTAESIKTYIDGALIATDATGGNTVPVPASEWLRWAQYGGGSSAMNGTLDEVALFDSVLTLGNVQALYTLGSAAPQLVTPTTAALTLTTFAPTVTATAHQTVTPTTLALTLTTFVPTVTATDHQTVTPTTLALTLATFAPTVTASDHQTVTPTTVALALATFAPTVTATELQLVTPTTASLAVATFAPTVTASDHKTVTPTTAALTLATFAPVVALAVTPTTAALVTAAFAPTVTASNHQSVTPTTASLALTAFAATVSLSNNQSVTPTTATLTLATFAPVLKLVVTPSTTALALTTFAPTVSATAHVVATPTTLALTLTTFAATVTATAHQTVTPTTAALVLTTQAPSVTTGGNVEFVPNPVALTLTTFAPTVTGAQNVTVTPTTAALALTTFAATVTATAHQTVTPTTKALTLAVFTPAVTATDSKLVTPTTAALVTAKFAPTVTASNHQTATPTTKALALATFAPTVSATAHQVATPTTLALTLTRFAPTVTASNVTGVTPSTAALTLTTYAPTVTAIANIVVTPSTAALILTAYAPQLRQTVTVPSASLTLTTFAPSANVSDNTYVVPGTLPLVLTGYDPDVVGIGPVTIVPSTGGLVLAGYAPLVFEAGPIDFIDGELVVADPVRGVLVVTSPHHGASVGANGRGRTTLVVTTPYIKGDVESN